MACGALVTADAATPDWGQGKVLLGVETITVTVNVETLLRTIDCR